MRIGRKFYDDELGWQNVYAGPNYWNRQPCVIATLASSEDPINPAYLSVDEARAFADALMRAAQAIEEDMT